MDVAGCAEQMRTRDDRSGTVWVRRWEPVAGGNRVLREDTGEEGHTWKEAHAGKL